MAPDTVASSTFVELAWVVPPYPLRSIRDAPGADQRRPLFLRDANTAIWPSWTNSRNTWTFPFGGPRRCWLATHHPRGGAYADRAVLRMRPATRHPRKLPREAIFQTSMRGKRGLQRAQQKQ